MESLRKDPRISTRYSSEQLDRLGLAACVASRRAREEIDESTLSRQITNTGVEDLLGTASPDELKQAQQDLDARRHKARERKEAKHGERRTKRDRRQSARV